jgi:hypothetical protein
MKKGFSEQEVLELLDHLKSAGNEYPSDMIRSRREVFIKQALAMATLTGPGGENGGSSAGSLSSGLESFTLGRFFEIALVLALAAGAGVTAYIYRDTIADFVNSTLLPKTEVTAVSPQDSSSEPAVIPVTGEEDASESPNLVPTLTSPPNAATPVTVVSSTPEPSHASQDSVEETVMAEDAHVEGSDLESLNAESVVEVQSTPVPNDNSGLHIGQTPKPERTLPANNNGPPNGNRTPGNNRTP